VTPGNEASPTMLGAAEGIENYPDVKAQLNAISKKHGIGSRTGVWRLACGERVKLEESAGQCVAMEQGLSGVRGR
jgi:hypothetical protein